MKKIKLMLVMLIIMLVLVSCGNKNNNGKSVVCTIAPQYSWTKELLNDIDDKDLTLLVNDGKDVHSYQPSASDIAKVYDANMFIYVGGESDSWVDDVLAQSKKHNPNRIVINLMKVLKDRIKEEETVEGMQDTCDGNEDEIEYDEHIWLSLKNARICTDAIAKGLIDLGYDENQINTNKNTYIAKLTELDNKFQALVDDSTVNTILFGDRFPFRYLVDDYNIKYYAAFVGCSTETSASAKTITFLASKLNELNLKYVIVLEGSDQSIAKSIINASIDKNQQIVVFNSLQHITLKQLNNGTSYISLMEENYSKLTIVLN